jgi:hypothetical protein
MGVIEQLHYYGGTLLRKLIETRDSEMQKWIGHEIFGL